MKLRLARLDSPLGGLRLAIDAQGLLRAVDFQDHDGHLHRGLRTRYGQYEAAEGPAPAGIAARFVRYFEGDLAALDDIPTATAGTALQRQVWAALRGIPAGRTASYGELARALGYADPRMAIEIGAANAANPFAIVVPCHRVIGKDGALKGYAWGLARKRWLLAHEGALAEAARA